ncbi:hypothetical protein BJ138DRAFT_1061353 [Hygrophoropsis aurantiaca]|uniref:Uncharacterized protein n=1 Tax=Hygrophoropsis aurantiaca TaxID=72124 RepID=A0ACB8AGQ1_9AGAM|nr:hypothetical protein BJ138DRAFT_1061353 [Hygrophoropsis aurantiaca]
MSLNTTDFTPLSPSQSRGVIVVAVFALSSALALGFIVFRSLRLVLIPSLRRDANTYNAPENLFFRTTLGHYAACLVLSNVFISAAGLIEFDWASQSGMTRGPLCSTQAILMQIGSWSTCIFTVTIGLHTCNSLVFRLRHVPWLSPTVIAIGWIVSFVAALAPLNEVDIYGPVGISCGIAGNHQTPIILLEAFPVILGAVLSMILYSLIFLVLQGQLRIKGGLKFTFKSQERWSALSDFEEYHRFIAAVAQSMLWYPIAFVIFLLPFCVVSLLPLSGVAVPVSLDIFAHVCCFMLGLVNVALLYNTFRVLSPVFHGDSPKKIGSEIEKPFENTFDKSPALPPPVMTTKGLTLPLYNTNDGRGSVSSQSSSGSVTSYLLHSRTSSDASTNSATLLLSAEQKSELGLSGIVSPQTHITKPNQLRLDIPSQEPLSAALVTVHLTPTPRVSDALASPSPAKPPMSSVFHLNRKFTETFGVKRPRGSRLPAKMDTHLRPPSTLPIGTALPSISSQRPAERRKPQPLDLTDAMRPIPSVRPLPSIDNSVIVSVHRLNKGKEKTMSSASPTPSVQVTITSSTPRRTSGRPLPYIPSSVESLMSPTPRSSISASSCSEPLPRPSSHLAITSHVNHTHSASSLASKSSIRDSFASEISWYSSPESDYTSQGNVRPLPIVPKPVHNQLSVSNSGSNHRQTMQSRRTTMTSIWSQDSAEGSQCPDHDATMAYAKLFPGVSSSSKTAVPAASQRSMPNALRPGKLASRLTGRFAEATGLKSPPLSAELKRGFQMVAPAPGTRA